MVGPVNAAAISGRLGEFVFKEIPEELADDPWFKFVEFLQQNWAVIVDKGATAVVVFYGDTRGVFDELEFESADDATEALIRNGFSKYLADKKSQEFIGLPRGEFREQAHPNGRIYSSGRFWQ